jgi:hypothetical protein
MTVFLFATASVALLAGLVGLIAGHLPWTTGRQWFPRASGPARERGATTGSHGKRQAGRSVERRRTSTMT